MCLFKILSLITESRLFLASHMYSLSGGQLLGHWSSDVPFEFTSSPVINCLRHLLH